MSLSLSPQLRMIVIFGGAALVLALGGMMFVLRSAVMSSEVEQVPVVVHHAKPAKVAPVHKGAPATAPKAHKSAAPKVATHNVTAPTAQTVTTPKVTAPPVTTPEVTTPAPTRTIQTPGVAANGLPIVIAQVLRKHPVVVVALVVPGGDVDDMTVAEARAGAKAAGVGFLSVNILKNSVGRPLAQKLGVIQTPSLVIYRRPATLFVRFAGFTDRDTVEQAATSARSAR